MEIKDKVVIITGGTGGIGFATVQALLKHGAKHVAIFDVEATKARGSVCIQTVEKEFGKGRTTFHSCDVTNSNEFTALYDEVVKSQKTVDVLINNAGILSDVQGNLMIDINLKAVINCSLTAIERMGKHNNGKGGTILNLASTAGLETFPQFPIYVATKYGVYAFTKSLKEHYEHTKVRALLVCPGATLTDLFLQNWREHSLSFVQDKFIDELRQFTEPTQPPEAVALTIIKMLNKAKSGDVWVTELNEPPYAIMDVPHYANRKIPL